MIPFNTGSVLFSILIELSVCLESLKVKCFDSQHVEDGKMLFEGFNFHIFK